MSAESGEVQPGGVQPGGVGLALGYAALCAQARSHWESREWPATITLAQQAILQEPQRGEAYTILGNGLSAQNRREPALRAYAKALEFDPLALEALVNAGNLCVELGHRQRAIECYQQALILDPTVPSIYHNLAKLEADDHNLEAAATLYQQALALDPNSRLTQTFLGETLAHLERYGEAQQIFENLLARLPEARPEILPKLAFVYQHGGDLPKAIALGQQAIAEGVATPQSRLNLAYALLKTSPCQAGWDEAEWRFQIEPFSFFARRCEPRWQGEDLQGKTILLHQEQGLGDTIQFCRFAPLLAARGARVLLQCEGSLQRLLGSLAGVDRLVDWDEPTAIASTNPPPAFDVALPLLSVPQVLGTTRETIPAQIPYLSAPVAAREDLKNRLDLDGDRLNVGLVWASGYKPEHPDLIRDYRQRSLGLAPLLAACEMPGVALWSLQVGHDALGGNSPTIRDLSDRLGDLADTAAVMEQLDLVISVDTAAAHLAGALARPVWIVLRSACDWRWGSTGTESAWYPTARLFRQHQAGDWSGALAQVRSALVAQVADRT